jgi:hypothetical protein
VIVGPKARRGSLVQRDTTILTRPQQAGKRDRQRTRPAPAQDAQIVRPSTQPNPKKRHILREEINPVEADAIRDAATRVLEHGETVASIMRDWTARGIKPVAAKQWWPTSIVGTLTSARLAGLLEWQGKKYPATQWPAIIDVDTHERLVKLFADPARRKRRAATIPAGSLTVSIESTPGTLTMQPRPDALRMLFAVVIPEAKGACHQDD